VQSPRRTSSDDPLGTIVLGRYRILRELAKGGMGVVYLARMEGAAGFVKPVVVKLVLPERAEDARYAAMFVREAKILAQLKHPGIVDVIELGEENGVYVMVLEYVRGYHLGQWLDYLALRKRVVPGPVAILIATDVLEALHRAHITCYPDGTSMQIAHRDVSPSNIILDEERARLLDFGVARLRGPNADYRTVATAFVGKLSYGAPEMFNGAEATPESDLYACAVVLHEMLLGRNTFRVRTQSQTLERVLYHVPEALEPLRPELPRGLDAVLAKALAKEPQDRHKSALELATALRALQTAPEAETRKELAALLATDFNTEMAAMLNIESLADRDASWSRLSSKPPHPEGVSGEVAAAKAPAAGNAASSTKPPPRGGHATAQTGQAPEEATAEHTETYASLHLGSGISNPALTPPRTPPELSQISKRMEVTQAQRTPTAPPSTPVKPIEPTPRSPSGAEMTPAGPSDTGNTATQALAQGGFYRSALVIVSLLLVVAVALLVRSATVRKGFDPRDLTLAVEAKQALFAGCFARYSSPGGTASVELAFDLDSQGTLERVSVAPALVAETELGRCLTDVAGSVRFPAPGQPVSFALPIAAGGATLAR